MARNRDHYESAFEDYLRVRNIPFVSVDETRRAVFAGTKIKSFDYVVYPPARRAWLVDVKGRHWHSTPATRTRETSRKPL